MLRVRVANASAKKGKIGIKKSRRCKEDILGSLSRNFVPKCRCKSGKGERGGGCRLDIGVIPCEKKQRTDGSRKESCAALLSLQ